MHSYLVVVSGLPRSGTSLMMAALAAGGLPLSSDPSRPPDLHNPRGYFEDRRVLTLAREADWLHEQQGRGVKILSHLLPAIPVLVPAKVLFMRRPLDQVIASQNAMLGSADHSRDWAALLARDLAATLDWLGGQNHLQTLEVSYPHLIASPGAEFARVVEFLGGKNLNLEAMIATVEPSLHRQR